MYVNLKQTQNYVNLNLLYVNLFFIFCSILPFKPQANWIDSDQSVHEPQHKKPMTCIGENKGADQLCSNCCTADQRLCFRYTDTIFLLLNP